MADRGDARNAGHPESMAGEFEIIGPAIYTEKALTQRILRNAERHRECRKRKNIVDG
jgi:hypothetical protein